MDLKSLLNQEAALITQKPVKHKIQGKEIVINPLTVEQIMLINPYLTNIAGNDLDEMQNMIETTEFSRMPELVSRYLPDIKSIIEIVTGDTHEKTATMQDYFILLTLILSRSGQLYFQKSIILASEMSPTKRPEIIAVRKFLTSLN